MRDGAARPLVRDDGGAFAVRVQHWTTPPALAPAHEHGEPTRWCAAMVAACAPLLPLVSAAVCAASGDADADAHEAHAAADTYADADARVGDRIGMLQPSAAFTAALDTVYARARLATAKEAMAAAATHTTDAAATVLPQQQQQHSALERVRLWHAELSASAERGTCTLDRDGTCMLRHVLLEHDGGDTAATLTLGIEAAPSGILHRVRIRAAGADCTVSCMPMPRDADALSRELLIALNDPGAASGSALCVLDTAVTPHLALR